MKKQPHGFLTKLAQAAAWFFNEACTGNRKAKGNKWKFLFSNALQSVEEVTDYSLGEPAAESQICGEGSRERMKRIRCAAQSAENAASSLSDSELLLLWLKEVTKKATNDVECRKLLGIEAALKVLVWDKSERPASCRDGEQALCDAGKRPITKTKPSHQEQATWMGSMHKPCFP